MKCYCQLLFIFYIGLKCTSITQNTCCCGLLYLKPVPYSFTLDQVTPGWTGLVSGSGFCYSSFGRSSVSPCSGRDAVEGGALVLGLLPLIYLSYARLHVDVL